MNMRVVGPVAFAGWLVLAAAAAAHDGDAGLDQWYRSLMTPTGESCCNMRDCAPTDARLRDGQWEVVDPSRVLTSNPPQPAWLPVPQDRVLRRENHDGRPVVCIRGGEVICFVPPAGA